MYASYFVAYARVCVLKYADIVVDERLAESFGVSLTWRVLSLTMFPPSWERRPTRAVLFFHAILETSEVDGSAISYSLFLQLLYYISPAVQILALHTLATIFTVGITQQPIPRIVIYAVYIVFLVSSPADLDIDKQHP
jgi:hypothetical protein